MKVNKMNNTKKKQTIIAFTNKELDVIYDALTELENMIDNNKTQNIISDICTKMFNAQFTQQK
jgi:5-methylthioribose kinase